MLFVSTHARTVNFTRVFSAMGELFIDNMISAPNEVSINV